MARDIMETTTIVIMETMEIMENSGGAVIVTIKDGSNNVSEK